MIHGVLKQVFSQYRYSITALIVTLLVISGLLLLPYAPLINQVISSGADVWDKMTFVLSLYATIYTKFHWYGIINLIMISILFGINVALIIYYIKQRRVKSGSVGLSLAGMGGLVSSLLGIGCASCGSVIVVSVLGLFGASGILLLLPFQGAEFAVLGLFMLLFSIYYLIKKISNPLVCNMKS
jgi:hypothetical protein